jgi:hypothetical protein
MGSARMLLGRWRRTRPTRRAIRSTRVRVNPTRQAIRRPDLVCTSPPTVATAGP